MITEPRRRLGSACVASVLLVSVLALPAGADEIFVPPTYQTDLGFGLGIGTFTLWPVTKLSAARMIFEVPNDLQTFQRANVVFVPGPAGASNLNVFVCSGQPGDLVTGPCDRLVAYPFASVPDQITEVDISGIVGSHAGLPGPRYITVAAFTLPVTEIDGEFNRSMRQ